MKTSPRSILPLVALTGFILGARAQSQVTGINAASSSASIQFDDTTSLDPLFTPGSTNITPTVSPWTGLTHNLPFTTDPITFDTAQGSVTATFATPGPNDYDLAFSNVLLTQAIGNTQFAHLIFNFSVEFQIGGGGLPSQPTLFPNFNVTGTVQPAGFAALSGFINYSGVNTAGTISTFETVNYNYFNNTPGGFSSLVSGTPVNGTTPALVANTTMTLSGQINFMVDPASISAESVSAPEPTAGVLVLLSALPLLLRRRRA